MEPTEITRESLSHNIKKYTLYMKIFGAILIACILGLIISILCRSEKVPVAIDDAQKGDYVTLNVILLIKYSSNEDFTYFCYTAQNGEHGTIEGELKLSNEVAESDIIKNLIDNEENTSPVIMYGTIREEAVQSLVGGTINKKIIRAGLTPEKARTGAEWLFLILASASCALLRVFTSKRKSAKRHLRFMSAMNQ